MQLSSPMTRSAKCMDNGVGPQPLLALEVYS